MPRKRKLARLFQRKDDGAWIILDGGRQFRTGYGDGFHRQAEEELAKYIAQKRVHFTGPADPSEITIGEVLRFYGEAKVDEVSDPERLLYTMKALAPYWGDRKVSEIDVKTCRGYTSWRDRAAWTVRREMSTLNAAVKFAAASRKIAHAPVVTLPEKGLAKDRWLTRDEARRLIEVSPRHIQRFIMIGLYTGRRKTAITRLRWTPSLDSGWVDLERGVIHFLGKAQAETKKRKGAVRIPTVLLKEMNSWERDCDHVISFNGSPVGRIDKAFRAAAKRANLDEATPHTLKHTAVTWAFMKGMTLEDASAYFDTSSETLENVYRSYSPEALKTAAGIMNWEI